MEELETLRKFIGNFAPLNDTEWQQFAMLWKPVTFKRKEIITGIGEPERYLYFVLEGVQRVYYHDEQGREATLVFTYPPSFAGVLDAMLAQRNATYCFEALTKSRLLRAPFNEISKLKEQSPAVNNFISTALTATITGLLERMAQLQCFSAEDKFRALLKRNPQILNQVPHKYLANYLGIDPTNFSKFINKIVI